MKADFACFDLTIEDKIAHLRFNRPDEMNSMTRDFWNDIPLALEAVSDSGAARCLIISSTGKHFTCGMDLSVFAGNGLGLSEQDIEKSKSQKIPPDRATMMEADRHFIHHVQDKLSCLDQARIPVISAIQGGCIGGGLDLVAATDIRYATTDAFFCIQEINIGMTADAGTFPRLCHLLPQGWVRELAYTGARLPATRAQEIGLVNSVFCSHEAMMDHVMEVAREIVSRSPVAVAGSKVMINYARDHTIRDGLDYIATWQTGMFSQDQVRETITAIHEKRSPAYPNLLPIRKTL